MDPGGLKGSGSDLREKPPRQRDIHVFRCRGLNFYSYAMEDMKLFENKKIEKMLVFSMVEENQIVSSVL